MNVYRPIWGAAAALSLLAGTAAALSPTSIYAICYTCQVSSGDSVCVAGGGYYGWTNTCVSGMRYYLSAPLTGGGLAAPKPLFVFKDGQVMRMPDTPANIAAPPLPPSLSPDSVGAGGAPASTASDDLSVRPLENARGAAGDANRARCISLALDGKVTSSEMTAWKRSNCAQYYN